MLLLLSFLDRSNKTTPRIAVLDYLQNITKHAALTVLSIIYYMDRLCLRYPALTVITLTVHCFLIAAATVAAKGLSDPTTVMRRMRGLAVSGLPSSTCLELELFRRVN